ncbi:hypothetical protein BGZ96_001744 [Linnemannia gamsii]|uniref:F-box domain-containing protein n=1 Tax=Linnemannia gamsii TaxID=64522 RepID=A0ABQ7K8S5_9FUNG|nr:hypothetical protein BGZ96_001744 [Linnemannia gamsii]
MNDSFRHAFNTNVPTRTLQLALLLVQDYEYRNGVEQSDKRVPTLYKSSSLKELALQIGHRLDVSWDRLPYPSTLTSLELDLLYWTNTSEHLGKILKTCPLLEILSIKTKSSRGQHLTWNTLDKKLQPIPFPIRSLSLRNVCLSQYDLENLMFTPHLRSLVLMSPDWRPNSEYNVPRLIAHCKALHITLDTVHFSDIEQPAPPDLELQLAQICPSTSNWILWALDMTPKSMEMLSRWTNFVTTLELCWKPQATVRNNHCCTGDLMVPLRLLHDILCKSAQLVHLKTLKAPIRPQYIDLYDGDDDDFRIDPQGRLTLPPIWSCRGLEILHVELHGKFDPRVFYGYISRVLPQLQELVIIRPEYCESALTVYLHTSSLFWLKEGGLCLLSRLQHLVRLWIKSEGREFRITEDTARMSLSWIIPHSSSCFSSLFYFGERSGGCGGDKAKRREYMEKGENWETLVVGDNNERKPRNRPPPINAKPADAAIWCQLRNLGFYQDVAEMVKEMDSKGFRGLPALKKLALGSSYLKRPEEELDDQFRSKKWYHRFIEE